ncbi:MAG: hypothetical protein AAGF83_16915 [Cyanobacteria bacterium P01_G01_bin.67]
MKTVKKLVRNLSIVAITFAFLMFLVAPAAMAASNMRAVESIVESIEIKDGGFDVNVPGSVPEKLRIAFAVVALPAGETGIINSIAITGPDGQREFGCENLKVTNGTDLIQSCGGPAYLAPGKTTYMAKGSNFQPQGDVKFSIKLSE